MTWNSFHSGLVNIFTLINVLSVFQILLGLSTGVHVTSPQLEIIPVKAFRIEPDVSESYGHVTVDGEKVDYGPIQAEIFPDLAYIMSR